MSLLSRVAAAALLAAVLWVSARPLGPLPPLGPFLEPASGVWAAARGADLPRRARGAIPGLAAPVEVVYDDRSVPHIFAASPDDAYRALGHVVARDRLFQLELQTRATAGRLSELLGPRALDLDRRQRRLGLAWSAERGFAALPRDAPARQAAEAYADGVNAWIAGLSPGDLPLEYHLLDARPMRWEPQYTIYLLRRMGWTLVYRPDELRRQRAAELVGPAAAAALFPARSPIQDPIQPGPGPYPRFDWRVLAPPRDGASRGAGLMEGRESGTALGPAGADALDAIGSNNWAVAPSRSATGHALLAGDPHLELTLPSVWYEAHLAVRRRDTVVGAPAPDPSSRRSPELDVYGVTIPGAPGIVIGFNRDLAWSLTNTEADVLDYYKERLDDPAHPTRYLLDGAWLPLERRVETYRGRHGETLATDTVFFTHRGPLVVDRGQPLSLRWTVLETTAELTALGAGARAHDVDGFLRNTEGFQAAAQNMIVADRGGNIAVRSTGRFPLRPGDGDGLVIRDGTTRASDWRGDWPVKRYPLGRNPPQGFLSSANQQPIDPRVDATYLGANWGFPWRAMRINELLRADASVTVDDMRRWQTDPGSARADLFIPYFLAAAGLGRSPDPRGGRSADRPGARADGDTLARVAAGLLEQWDRRYTRDNTRAVLFELAMDCLPNLVWEELQDSSGRRVFTPPDVMLAELLQDPKNGWWDRRSTRDVVEDRDAVLRQCLAQALTQAVRRYGPPAAGGWRWDRVQHTNIYHLLRIPAFSALDLPMQGGRSTLSPSAGDGTNGASWRMVVELGPEIRAWGTYPGGQSGNPVSARYLDRLGTWLAGDLDSLRVPREPGDLGTGATARLTLVPLKATP